MHIPLGLDATILLRSCNDWEPNRIEKKILFNAFVVDSTNPPGIFVWEVVNRMPQTLEEIAVWTEFWSESGF